MRAARGCESGGEPAKNADGSAAAGRDRRLFGPLTGDIPYQEIAGGSPPAEQAGPAVRCR
ncbi:hypothetical protein BL253_06775 [Pseudofrankia asymbiotica]|uniref:Uncharacterized protein n=1 Tax=Pseudofrankia asymbiotica TaxID=1834516 RepID=A0A1V2IF76_9ACTN|nr:hypothetical protein BL253_06775 [Pseudofrankia asymbiotica]